jgi:hypothetical protein
VTDLPPVNKVTAVKKWDTREIFKAAGDQIIIFAHTANARIRIKTWEDRVGILHFMAPRL